MNVLTPGVCIELVIEKPAAGGRMIGRHDGQVVLVDGTLPGERVRARVERADRGVAHATVVDVLQASPHRRPVAGDPRCGGGVFSHIAYVRQLELKGEIVADAFRRISKLPLDRPVPVAASPEHGYRMRARLHVRGGRVGFFREGTHELCDAAATGQLLPETGRVLAGVEAALRDLRARAVRSIELAENLPGGQRVLHLDLRPEPAEPPSAYSVLARVPGVTGVTCPAPSRRDVLVLGGRPTVADPLTSIVGARPSIPPGAALGRRANSFFQANRYLLADLVARVAAWIPNGPAIDLYAGVGLFAVSLAALGRDHLTAIEADHASGGDLVENARPFASQLTVRCQPVELFLRTRPDEPAGVLLVDPPRTGMSREAIDGVCASHVDRVVYVSCDVATLARDVRRLVEAGYRLVDVEAFDLFPNTAHVESLAVLERGRRQG